MCTIALADANARSSELVDRVETGESLDITRRAKVVTRLTPAIRPRVAIDPALLAAVTAGLISAAPRWPVRFGEEVATHAPFRGISLTCNSHPTARA
jgi:prevent-host-death family protein